MISINKNNSLVISNNVFNKNNITDFINYLDVSAQTTRTYIYGLKQFADYMKSEMISNPDRNTVLNFKRMLIEKCLKPSSIALYLASVRRFFEWTSQAGIYDNIAAGVKSPKQEKGHKRDFLGAEQIKECLNISRDNTLKGLRDYAVLSLMAIGGLRTIEITRANIEDIQTIGGQFVLYIQGKGRTDKKEFIKLTQPVINAINAYLNARGNVKTSEPLFVSTANRNKNGRLTTRTISGIAKTAMRKIGLNSRRLTAHSFRHSAVTLALMSGATIQDVQAFARHTSINTTMIYAHNIDRLKSVCESNITGAVFGLS